MPEFTIGDESHHECPTNDGDCICETCDYDVSEYGNRDCKSCKQAKGYAEEINTSYDQPIGNESYEIQCDYCREEFISKSDKDEHTTFVHTCHYCDWEGNNLSEHEEKIHGNEVNTSYDQEQPIGDAPQAYMGAGAEPINAKNGSGFMDVGTFAESHLQIYYKCPECSKEFITELELIEHDLMEHDDPSKLQNDNQTSHWESNKRIYEYRGEQDIKHGCPEGTTWDDITKTCMSINEWNERATKLTKERGEWFIKCNCGKKFENQHNLYEHIDDMGNYQGRWDHAYQSSGYESKKQYYECEECGKKFLHDIDGSNRFIKHKINDHGVNEKNAFDSVEYQDMFFNELDYNPYLNESHTDIEYRFNVMPWEKRVEMVGKINTDTFEEIKDPYYNDLSDSQKRIVEQKINKQGYESLKGICPNCGSTNTDLDILERQTWNGYQKYESWNCHDCGNTFNGDTIGESLNKDGSGVARATRGINPNNPKHIEMMFDYVSKDGCDICKQYDGMIFARDDEKRPVIPRLESAGWSARPYTHPNCKCRWVKVKEEYTVIDGVAVQENLSVESVDEKTIARARKWYGDNEKFDQLTELERNYEIIKMFKQALGMEYNDLHSTATGQFISKGKGDIAGKISKTYPNMNPKFIKEQVKKAEKLRNTARETNNKIQNDLSNISSIKVTGRIKEIESMVGKLARKPELYQDVSHLNDISGVRAMAKDLRGVNDTVSYLREKYNIIEEQDNIDQDRGGYRSFHAIVQDENGIKSEIQIRTENQDIWANWCHDRFYKPDPKLQSFINSNKEVITNYSLGMSDYFYKKDLGLNPQKPDCPPEIEQIGCIQ